MEVMESLESSQVGDAREVVAAMVLPVVHEGEIVVAGIQPDDQKSGNPGRKQEPRAAPRFASAPVMMTKSSVPMSALGSAWCCA